MTVEEFRRKHIRRSIRHEEDSIQMQCVGWFRGRFPGLAPLLFHVNNEAYFGGMTQDQRKAKGRRMSEMGVVPGVADLILMRPSGNAHGLCIEMKTEEGRQGDSQKAWQKAVEAQGYQYALIRGFGEFVELLLSYLQAAPSFADQLELRRLEMKRAERCKGRAKEKKGRNKND